MLDSKTQNKEAAASEKHRWVRLTRICNNNCIFCLDKETQDGTVIPLEEIKADIRAGREDGATRLILSGGEATLHPDFMKIVAHAKSLGYRRIQTVTNGRMFAYHDFLAQAIAAGLDEITFSMHGHYAELHEAQTRTPGSFAQALAGLANALKSGRLIVNVDIVINKFNYQVIDEIIDYFIRIGIHEFDLLHIVPAGEAWKNWDQVYYAPSEGIRHLNKAFDYSRRNDLYIWSNRFPASYLTAFPELIQNPLKLKDEVRGRKELFTGFVEHGVSPQCRGERCEYCFIKGLCEYLFHVKECLQQKRLPWLRVQADKLGEVFKIPSIHIGHAIVQGACVAEIQLPPDKFPKHAALSFQLEKYSGFTDFAKSLSASPEQIFVGDFRELERLGKIKGSNILLELNRRNGDFIQKEYNLLRRRGIRVFLKNRASLEQSRRRDLQPFRFFATDKLKHLKTVNIPFCVPCGGHERFPRAIDYRTIGKNLKIDMSMLCDDYILNHYYVYPSECGACPHQKNCPGIHINHLRAFGFQTPRE